MLILYHQCIIEKYHHLNKLSKLYNRITHLEADEPGGKLGKTGIIET